MTRTLLILLACLLVGVGMANAQPIDESAFWRLLEQTDQALGQAQPDLAALRQQWAGIDSVQIDGATATLDLAWIDDGLASGNPAQVDKLKRFIDALLNYHVHQTPSPDNAGASLTALSKVLSDPRFQYAQITPTPLPAPSESNSGTPSDAASLPSQVILIAVGVVVVVLVLSFIARSINVQSVELKTSAEDDPTNFAEARERADNLEAARDYRSAIRYLYLSSLLLLDEHRLIHYDASLTNREHLRQIANQPPLFEALRQVINTFEDVWYGFQPVDEDFYQQYRRSIDHLRQLIT
ncbi:MAG TPA: DUF4129 domain-containing protein [Phototrophicaceae bacterium]|nr:DUF4129 domain-containing protein [Phototrophicaceae bacterium]